MNAVGAAGRTRDRAQVPPIERATLREDRGIESDLGALEERPSVDDTDVDRSLLAGRDDPGGRIEIAGDPETPGKVHHAAEGQNRHRRAAAAVQQLAGNELSGAIAAGCDHGPASVDERVAHSQPRVGLG